MLAGHHLQTSSLPITVLLLLAYVQAALLPQAAAGVHEEC